MAVQKIIYPSTLHRYTGRDNARAGWDMSWHVAAKFIN